LIEVRVAGSAGTLGSRWVSPETLQVDAIDAVRAELGQVRAILERLERTLPSAVAESGGAPLDRWADYYDAWYAKMRVERPDGDRWVIIIDAVEAEPRAVQTSVEAIVDQIMPGDLLIVLARPGQTEMADDLVRRARSLSSGKAETLVSDLAMRTDRLAVAITRAGARQFCLLVHPGNALAGSALGCFGQRLAALPTIQAVYVDEDRVDPLDPRQRHADPILKPGPDPDLLLQTPYVGRTAAFRTRPLASALASLSEVSRLAAGGWEVPRLVLEMMHIPAAVDHLPLVLVTRTEADADPDDQSTAWRHIVQAHLAEKGEDADIVPHTDVLGAVQPGAVRVVRAAPENVTATVIVTTRDRHDLLYPCIESVRTYRRANRTTMKLCIVDHESIEPATLSYLSALKDDGVDVLRHEGAFNWALMNNVAAARAEGDVLVFLNNDTVVLSADWLDALVVQALRPEVGVVGARLIYADGGIQHAGFLVREEGLDGLVHDGVGVPGSDGGYLGRHALVHRAPVVTGACMAIRSSLFSEVGGFDAAVLPVEGNDVDLCCRAKAHGLSVLYEPRATLYHLESQSRGFAAAGTAMPTLWARWARMLKQDRSFNPHFDRRGAPYRRLRPPVSPSWGLT
jgi:GT2 family glycosyltransferase